jgi:hypothetical protein
MELIAAQHALQLFWAQHRPPKRFETRLPNLGPERLRKTNAFPEKSIVGSSSRMSARAST